MLNSKWKAVRDARRTLTMKEKAAARRLAKDRRQKADALIGEAVMLEEMTNNWWPPAPCHDRERQRGG